MKNNTCKIRLERIRQKMKSQNLQGFLIRTTSNIQWLCGFNGVFDTSNEQPHSVFITPTNAVLLTDGRYIEAMRDAAKQQSDFPLTLMGKPQKVGAFALSVWKEYNNHKDNCLNKRSSGSEKIGLEDCMTVSDYNDLCKSFSNIKHNSTNYQSDTQECPQNCISLPENVFTLTHNFILEMRAIKSSDELQLLKKAQSITDAAFQKILGKIEPGMTEKHIQIELDNTLFKLGAEQCAFESIVAVGAHTAKPHAQPGLATLKPNDILLMDFGAIYCGYCSDMTRTIFVGKPTKKMLRAWDTLKQIEETVANKIKPGIVPANLQSLAEEMLESKGFKGRMNHGLGHGVGMDIHELPSLNSQNTETLVEGNVITIEPGIYIPGEFGMRLEDFGVITCTGFECFTQSSHDLIVV